MADSNTGAIRRELLRHFGLPSFERFPYLPEPVAESRSPLAAAGVRASDAPILALIATRSHLAFAEVAARTFLAHHPAFRAMLLLVDGSEADRDVLDRVTTLLLDDFDLPDRGWLTTKLDATELSNTIKPLFLRTLASFADRAVYLDCDVAVFAPSTALLAALDEADLVLIPHMLELFPRPNEQWRRPNNADIFNSGLINAGCFGIRLGSPGASQFLQFWHDANLHHAWSADEGRQTDQQFLNWALIKCDHVCVLRDPSYNVAYWNLHERSLRQTAPCDAELAFTVEGQPLTFFHFSGFDPNDVLRLSRHDQRYSVYTLPSVALMLEWYSRQILASPAARRTQETYRFDVMANGVRLSHFLRDVLKRYDAYMPRFDGSTRYGADALCAFLMTPLPATGSRLPLLAAVIYESRPDLQEGYPGAHVDLRPTGFCRWFYQHASTEYEIEPLIAGFRRTLDSDSLVGFVSEIELKLPRSGRPCRLLGVDRRRAAAEFRIMGRPDLAHVLLSGETEWFFFSDFSAILTVYERRLDLQESYPDPFGQDHEQFLVWLHLHGTSEHGLSDAMAAQFAEKSASQVLARMFSILSRRQDLGAIAVDELLSERPERLFRDLIRGAGEGLEYDLADVEVFCFLHRFERARLVPLYLELPPLRRRTTSSRTQEGQRALLPRPVDQDWLLAGCRLHEACFTPADIALEHEIRQLHHRMTSTGQDVISVLHARQLEVGAGHLTRLAEKRAIRALRARDQDAASLSSGHAGWHGGVNMFGYFLAQTGVGESSRGLCRATELVTQVRQVHQFTGHLARSARLEDLFVRYDHYADCNIFISYPHAHEDLIGLLPREITERRRNIIHLAWEQRDWNMHWRSIYRRYDEIWTISEFAAEPFREMLGPERVRVVPNVLIVDDFPQAAASAAASGRFARPRFRFLFVFDANSSIERKNPEAVLEAFAAAFAATRHAEAVELVMKVNNLDRPEHAARVSALRRQAARSGLKIEFDGRQLSREDLLLLIASADCYVSLHRSEGFGYTMAEAMYLGVPVIASGYSGNLEYMDPGNSYLVPCREVPVRLADGPFQRGSVWGEPDVAAACERMRHVVEDRADARQVGERAAASVRRKLLPEMVAEGLRAAFMPRPVRRSGEGS